MARGGENGTIDSRFFVTLSADAKWADDRYTAFGLLDQADGSMEVRDLWHRLQDKKIYSTCEERATSARALQFTDSSLLYRIC